jgi:C4-dicarboxylate-specific signal transduction histidine kinase
MLGLQRARNQAMRLARRLTTSLRRTRDRLLLSRAIDRILIESDDPKQALQAVLRKMGNMLHAQRLELWSWNENPSLMKCEDTWTSSLPRLRPEKSAYFELFIKNGLQKKGLIKIYASIISPLDQQIAFELEAIGSRIGQFIHTRETENALKEQQALMVAHSKMSALGEMAGGIAHEINNPLTIVQFRAAQIERSVLKLEDCPEALETESQKLLQNTRSVKDMVERIAKIIRSLRSFTRNGSQDPFSLVEVQTIFDDVLPLCEKKLRSLGIFLDCRLPAESPLLECRPVELSQVLLNLINNATDAVESLNEKWIRIECQDLGDDLVLTVTDSGAGISREIENRIFDPFFKTKLAGQGTGLGLSISIGIVRAHGGSLTLDKKSANTCFVIRLPKLQADIIPQSVT